MDHMLALIGRDSSLTGRVDLWEVVWPKMLEHPWLGYGYNSFWLGFESAQSADIWSIMKWNVPHSHNAFLDLVQELGLVGLGIFFWGFVIAVQRSIVWLRWNPSILGLWPITYLSFTLLSNMSEDAILKQDNMFWLLYVMTWLFLSATVPALQRSARTASVTAIDTATIDPMLNLEGAR
jgi:O-antigen ligase